MEQKDNDRRARKCIYKIKFVYQFFQDFDLKLSLSLVPKGRSRSKLCMSISADFSPEVQPTVDQPSIIEWSSSGEDDLSDVVPLQPECKTDGKFSAQKPSTAKSMPQKRYNETPATVSRKQTKSRTQQNSVSKWNHTSKKCSTARSVKYSQSNWTENVGFFTDDRVKDPQPFEDSQVSMKKQFHIFIKMYNTLQVFRCGKLVGKEACL